jgi:dephospho-CoA kinase
LTKSHTTVLRVGVTGGIGSGKSTVCKLLTTFGRTVLSADDIAKHLTNGNADIQAAIRSEFGDSVFFENGMLDRKALAAVAFKSKEAVSALNAIVHPHVFTALETEIQNLKSSQRSPYVVIEAALMYETRMDDDLNYVIVVAADEETRVSRVMNRDKVTRNEVRARMKLQMDEKEKIELADFVIINEGTQADLIERVKFIDRLLPMLASQPKQS